MCQCQSLWGCIWWPHMHICSLVLYLLTCLEHCYTYPCCTLLSPAHSLQLACLVSGVYLVCDVGWKLNPVFHQTQHLWKKDTLTAPTL